MDFNLWLGGDSDAFLHNSEGNDLDFDDSRFGFAAREIEAANGDGTQISCTEPYPVHTSDHLVRFGGYSGSWNGIDDCWYSSDGYVYGPTGTRLDKI